MDEEDGAVVAVFEIVVGVGSVVVPVVLWGMDRWRPPKSKKSLNPANEPADSSGPGTG